MNIKRPMIEAIFIVFLSMTIALIINAQLPKGMPLFKAKRSPPIQELPREIRLNNAVKEFNEGKALFADARPANDYRKGHIKGAIHLPEQEFEEWINDFMSKNDAQKTIITYCDGSECHLAEKLAEKLRLAGFENAMYLIDGWKKWQEHLLPVDVSP